jgi:hypothetical protein
MFGPNEIAHWTEGDLLELWQERVAMAVEGGDVSHARAAYEAAYEVRRWSGWDWPRLPAELQKAARNKFQTGFLF